MINNIERTMNTAASVTLFDAISVNSSTSTTILAAVVPPTIRMGVTITVEVQDVWIKEQAASIDDDKKGFRLLRGQTATLPGDNVYTGEISAIAVVGTATITVTEK